MGIAFTYQISDSFTKTRCPVCLKFCSIQQYVYFRPLPLKSISHYHAMMPRFRILRSHERNCIKSCRPPSKRRQCFTVIVFHPQPSQLPGSRVLRITPGTLLAAAIDSLFLFMAVILWWGSAVTALDKPQKVCWPLSSGEYSYHVPGKRGARYVFFRLTN